MLSYVKLSLVCNESFKSATLLAWVEILAVPKVVGKINPFKTVEFASF